MSGRVSVAAAVVIAFFLCWAPFHTQRLLYLYAKDSPYYPQVNELLYTIAGCFYYFSSTVNPILYNLMSMKYRRAFRETLCGYSGLGRNRMSRDLQSSFRDTTVPLHTTTTCSTAEFRKSLVHRSTRNASHGGGFAYDDCGGPSATRATVAAVQPQQSPPPQQPPSEARSPLLLDDGRPPSAGNAADVLVMISPANGNAQCYKTLLRVTVQGSNKPTTATAVAPGTAGATAAADSRNGHNEPRADGGPHCIEIETCI